MKLRVGLVGLGQAWETRHLPALRALRDRFEIRAVCSEVTFRAQQAAAEFEADTVDGFRALAAREDIDALLMLSPEWYGSLPILAACETGKAVYCAAALEMEVNQASYVRDRVQNAGIAFMAEFPRRYAAATLRLKELIATSLGSPELLFCHLRKGYRLSNASAECEFTAARLHRDFLELVDWCRYVVGREPTSVVGTQTTNGKTGTLNYRTMTLDFSAVGDEYGSGPVSQISVGRYLPSEWKEAIGFRNPAGLQVNCENGIAFIDLPSTIVWFDDAGRHIESLEMERPVGEQMLSSFHRAVTSLIRKTSDLQDAYRALEIVQKAEESHRSGHRMMLSAD
ncbi:MAG: Gfo/Idh/MocA family oxidoreductase [Planctomycetales bacterium]|nr:Gfo/Idh/MocA family oxidoreductase [Planctomycetales bacterium]